MAKDVNLSSKEWTDIVFEGKNKEFGAYKLRENSPKRHNLAVAIVIGGLVIIVTILLLFVIGFFDKAEEDVNAQGAMTAVDIGDAEDDADEDEMVQDIEEMPEPEVPEEVQEEEEVTATQALTELAIVDEVEKDKEMKDISEILEDTRGLGNTDREGIEDLNKTVVIEQVVEKKPEPVVKKEEGPVNMAMVEQKPQFPGGDAEMYKWLGNQIVYPPAAAEEGVSGKVTVQFVVEKDGSISNVSVVRGKHPALDAEAVRVVKKMPKWVPGKNNGAPVRVIYMLPVTFKLQ